MVHPETGRVHASFNQVVAATGRLSSQRSRTCKTFRSAPSRAARFARRSCRASRAGSCWRPTIRRSSCACWHTSRGDPTLCAGVRARRGHPRPGGQRGVRRAAGGSDRRHAAQRQGGEFRRDLRPKSVRSGQAVEHRARRRRREFIDAYFDRYPGVEEFLAQILEECPKTGYVSTILGRRRAIRGIRRVASRQRNLPERTAINTVIQGSAADLIKLAMIDIHRRLRSERSPAQDAAADSRRTGLRSPRRRPARARPVGGRRDVERDGTGGAAEGGLEIGRQLGRVPGASAATNDITRERSGPCRAGVPWTKNRIPLVGIAGGIASGKSYVTELLRENGAAVILADEAAHKCLRIGRGEAPGPRAVGRRHFRFRRRSGSDANGKNRVCAATGRAARVKILGSNSSIPGSATLSGGKSLS